MSPPPDRQGLLPRAFLFECSFNDFKEGPFFAKNEAFGLGHGEILPAFRIRPQPRPVCLVGSQIVERNQSPRHIIGAFMREEVSDEVATAARNDSAPAFGVFFESVTLKGIDLITNEAGKHRCPPGQSSWCGVAGADEGSRRQHQKLDYFAPSYRVRNRSHCRKIPVAQYTRFVYHRNVNAHSDPDLSVAGIAAAIAEPARARMLYCLLDGHARTATELAIIGGVSPSTASSHLNQLMAQRLVRLSAQGKHRYYSIAGRDVAAALEALSVLAGEPNRRFAPSTPTALRAARTCYDHIAGTLGVSLYDRFTTLGWLSSASRDNQCDLTAAGIKALEVLGIDVAATRRLRRRFAYACVDWSERRPHLGGALAAGLLTVALKRKWIAQELDSRALRVTGFGRRELVTRFGLRI